MLIAINIAHRQNIDNAKLIFRPLSRNHEDFLLKSEEVFSDYFDNIYIESVPNQEHLITRSKRKIAEANTTSAAYVNKINPAYVYTFKDQDHFIQGILCKADTKRNYYVEDGLVAYDSFTFSKENTVKKAIKRVLFGGHYEDIQVYGTSKWIDYCLLTHPTHCRSEIRDKAKSIPNQLPNVINSKAEKWNNVIDTLDVLRDINVLVLVRHSESVKDKPRYLDTIKRICSSHKNYRVGLKYHPRENRKYVRGIDNGTIEIISSIPTEIIFVLSDSIMTVYGERSTALKSAKWIDRSIEVNSLLKRTDICQNLARLFDDLGINFVSEV
ncbi:hypothetical protein [Salinibacter ruber]|uniref:hypothetical protein n=1 Tax=Salinibacter ruber TaxID=146919 RepID=UPI0021675660|nr:hypothetical protein [Salinibacter ruber]